MLRLHGSRWAVALLFVCFAAQGISAASINPTTVNNENVYPEEYQLTNALSENLLFNAVSRIHIPNIIACFSYYLDEIKILAGEASALAQDVVRIITEFVNEYTKCGADINCRMLVVGKAVNEVFQHWSKIVSFLSNFKTTATKYLICTREGTPTPAPPTTELTTPEPTTPEPTTPEPTTPKPTTPKPTTPEHTTPEHTTPEHTTPKPTPPKTQEQVEDQQPSEQAKEPESQNNNYSGKIPQSIKNAYEAGKEAIKNFWSKIRN